MCVCVWVCVRASPKRKLIKLKEDFKQRRGGGGGSKGEKGTRSENNKFKLYQPHWTWAPCSPAINGGRRTVVKNTGDVYGLALKPALYFCLGIHTDMII